MLAEAVAARRRRSPLVRPRTAAFALLTSLGAASLFSNSRFLPHRNRSSFRSVKFWKERSERRHCINLQSAQLRRTKRGSSGCTRSVRSRGPRARERFERFERFEIRDSRDSREIRERRIGLRLSPLMSGRSSLWTVGRCLCRATAPQGPCLRFAVSMFEFLLAF